MERLTYRDEVGLATPKNRDTWFDICQKLAYYEDLEEQGRLIKLPCKVGDTVYEIREKHIYRDDECKECEYYCDYYDDIPRCGAYAVDGKRCNDYYFVGEQEMYILESILLRYKDFGKTVFLTKAEAEKALEGVKNGNAL